MKIIYFNNIYIYKDQIVTDVIHGSRGLQERLRWKSWFRGTRMINKLDLGNSQDADAYSINTTDSSKVLSAAREQSDGLGMGLGPQIRTTRAPPATPGVETFINQITMRLIREAETNLRPVFPSTNDKSHRIYQFLRILKLVREKVHILTDKTNTFKIVDTDKYVYWMEKKLK